MRIDSYRITAAISGVITVLSIFSCTNPVTFCERPSIALRYPIQLKTPLINRELNLLKFTLKLRNTAGPCIQECSEGITINVQ